MSGLGGQCQVCGCTDEQACPGGCIWANATATLCSACARDDHGHEVPGAYMIDDEADADDAGDWRGRS